MQFTKSKAHKLLEKSLAFISNLDSKTALTTAAKSLSLTWEDLIKNEYFITEFVLEEKRTKTNWKIVKFHEYEVLAGNTIPATIMLQKISDKRIVPYSFVDSEYLEVFFKRFDVLVKIETSSGEGKMSVPNALKNRLRTHN